MECHNGAQRTFDEHFEPTHFEQTRRWVSQSSPLDMSACRIGRWYLGGVSGPARSTALQASLWQPETPDQKPFDG
jgi:hypothetical protein